MTVSATNVYSGPYSGDGATKAFAFTFKAMATEEVQVLVNDVVQLSGYSVALTGSGGTVTFTAAPATGKIILIASSPDFTQDIDFANNGKFLADTHDEANDRAAVRALYLKHGLDRSVRGPVGDTTMDELPGPSARANKRVGFDGSGALALLDAGEKGDPGADTSGFGPFTSLGTTTIPVGITRIHSTGYSAQGIAVNAAGAAWYVLDADQVTANTGTMSRWRRQDAAGRYWRLADPQPYLEMFGAIGDTIERGTPGTDNIDAYTAFKAWATLYHNHDNEIAQDAQSVKAFGILRAGPGGFYFSATLDIKEGVHRLEGAGGGHVLAGVATGFYFPANTDGIRIQTHDTDGAGGPAVAGGRRGSGSTIKGLVLFGNGGTTGSGVWMRGRASCVDVLAQNFGLHGFRIDNNGIAGNANNWVLDHCSAGNNRLDGLFLDGGDSNAGYSIGFNARFNGRFGIYDSAFLNNAHWMPHAEFNGNATRGLLDSPNTTSAMCSFGGNRYGVVLGQSAAASTTQPGTDEAVWGLVGAGGINAEIPAWVSGMTWNDGGSYATDNANARTVFDAAYAESGQNLAQGESLTLYVGGQVGMLPGTKATRITASNGLYAMNRPMGMDSSFSYGTRTVKIQFGETGTAGEDTYLFLEDTNQGGTGNAWRLRNRDGDIVLEHDALTSRRPFQITGPSTAQQYGRGVAQPYFIELRNVAIGSGANARVVSNATAAPAAGTQAQGEIYWNRAPTLGSVFAWRCLTLGTPGTFEAIVGGLNTVGIGYVTGAGGTVTQATSRTTGVTLNKLSGAITLVSAAGSASWQTFTVTNSTVAATDTIIVNQKSGTDLNMIHVTAVGAGSFNISFATTGGTTVETPVFNFNVVKGVAA